MPFQPINFANIEPQGNPFFRDLVDNLASGYKSGQMPAQLERQRQKEEIANAMSKLLLEEEPQRFKSAQGSTALGNALKQLQIRAAEMDVDPEKKAAYINSLASAFGGGAGGDSGTGTGADIRKSLIRKALGLPAQTPEEQAAQQLDLYRQKQALKVSGELPTTATVTANQKVIQSIDNVLPLIAELKQFHAPGQFVSKFLKPNEQASYESKVGTIVDSLVGALKLPQVKESLNIVEKIVGKRPFEKDKNYLKRLTELENDLRQRRKRATSTNQGSASRAGGVANDDPLGIRG